MFNSEFNTIVKDQNGNTIPAHQMTSLAYRTPYLIRDIIDKKSTHVKADNF
jgi:hypothetical protein